MNDWPIVHLPPVAATDDSVSVIYGYSGFLAFVLRQVYRRWGNPEGCEEGGAE